MKRFVILAIASCLTMSFLHAAKEPVTQSSNIFPTDNWGDFLFLFCYGEIDPFDSPWHPVRHPVFQETLARMGVNLSCPVTISTDIGWGLRHEWTREWLKRPGTLMTPWYLWVDCVYGNRYPDPNPYAPWGCYNNPELKPHFIKVLTGIRDTYADRLLRIQGRPVINFEKEHPFSSAEHINRHYCKYCQESFRQWLKTWYGDASPDQDTNRDGHTMNTDCGTHYSQWNRIFKTYHDEETFRTMTAEKYQYPYFQFLWHRWLEDNAWRDFYIDVSNRVGIWQFCTETMPSRFLENQPFLYHYAFTLRQRYTGDYWTRRDPKKIAVSYFCGLYATDANTDPYFYDRYLARVCGQISRFRGIYQINFDSNEQSEMGRHQTSPREHPGCLEAHSWWSHTLGKQRWLFDQLLTHAPKVALYPGEDSFPANNDVQDLYMGLVKAGYPLHYLDRDLIMKDALKDYKVLLVNGERIPQEVMQKIVEFRQNGGYVCGYCTAMTWSLTRSEPELFRQVFGADVSRVIESKMNISQSVDHRAPLFKEADKRDVVFAYEKTDNSSPFWDGVRAAWDDNIFREDLAVLVKPITAKALATVKGISQGDEACITLSNDGHALFLGMHQATSSTLRTRFTTNFLEKIGVHRSVESDNPALEAYRLDSLNSTLQVLLFMNNDLSTSQSATVKVDPIPKDIQCIELKGLEIINLQYNQIKINIPPGQVRLFLLGTPSHVDKALQIQKQLAKDVRIFPWHCSTHFFFRRDYGKSGKAYTALGWKPFQELEAQPNCMIVLGSHPSPEDEAFAVKVATLIKQWPMAKNQVILPIKHDYEVTLEERKKYNLLLLGGSGENDWTKSECGRVGLIPPITGIVSHHEKGWYTGDSFIAILGTRLERKKSFVEFLDWMRLWLDSYAGYVPEKTW